MSKKELKTYFANMTYADLSGGGWSPAATWLRVHGDSKSSVKGVFHMETMLSSKGEHLAKIVGAGGASVANAVVAGTGTAAPTLPQVAAALKVAAGV